MSRNKTQGTYLGKLMGRHYRSGDTAGKSVENTRMLLVEGVLYEASYFENVTFHIRGQISKPAFWSRHSVGCKFIGRINLHGSDRSIAVKVLSHE
jgi:hypothetical protein